MFHMKPAQSGESFAGAISATTSQRRTVEVDRYLHLWAHAARQGVDVGMYRKQPWYMPSGYRESFRLPSEEDWNMADRVGRVVNKIRSRERITGMVVVYYFGAFPGAREMSKRDRLLYIKNELGVPNRDMHRRLDDARRIIEGAIEYA